MRESKVAVKTASHAVCEGATAVCHALFPLADLTARQYVTFLQHVKLTHTLLTPP